MAKYDYSILRGRIKQMYGNEKRFVIQLRDKEPDASMSEAAFNAKINGLSYFKQPEIEAICNLLKIEMNEVETYFFTQKYEFNSYKE